VRQTLQNLNDDSLASSSNSTDDLLEREEINCCDMMLAEVDGHASTPTIARAYHWTDKHVNKQG